MTWIEGIHCERSVRGAHECPISVFTGAVGDDLSTRDRRSAGVLNQAMHPSLHLTGSANGEPKDQGNHRDRSRANEGERDQCRFSHIVATCRSGSSWFVGYSEKIVPKGRSGEPTIFGRRTRRCFVLSEPVCRVLHWCFRRMIAANSRPTPRKKGWPKIPMQSTAANSAIASKLSRPSRSQYTSRRLSHSANSSSVRAAPTP